MYHLKNGRPAMRYENRIATFSIGRIEDVPVLHFNPGSLTLVFGTASCNFDCSYCLNSYTLKRDGNEALQYHLTPQELLQKALSEGCRNISFGINEPAVAFPYFMEIATMARKQGVKTAQCFRKYPTVR